MDNSHKDEASVTAGANEGDGKSVGERAQSSTITISNPTQLRRHSSGISRRSIIFPSSESFVFPPRSLLDHTTSSTYVTRKGHSLSWSNLSVSTADGKKILADNLNGQALPGRLTAILGHSGAGKTTFLKALTGRGKYTGEIRLDGEIIDPSSLATQRKIAFVAHQDTLEPTATVYECMAFSAALRLPTTEPSESVKTLLQSIMAELRLEHATNTQTRFLSAGERRRLSIGVELVVRPKILVLDEVRR